MYILSERTASQTGPELMRLPGIIALDSKDSVVLYMQSKRASSPTVKGRGRTDDFYLILVLVHLLISHSKLLFELPLQRFSAGFAVSTPDDLAHVLSSQFL